MKCINCGDRLTQSAAKDVKKGDSFKLCDKCAYLLNFGSKDESDKIFIKIKAGER